MKEFIRKNLTTITTIFIIILIIVVLYIGLNLYNNKKIENYEKTTYEILEIAKNYASFNKSEIEKNIFNYLQLDKKVTDGVVYVNRNNEVAMAIIYDDEICFTKLFNSENAINLYSTEVCKSIINVHVNTYSYDSNDGLYDKQDITNNEETNNKEENKNYKCIRSTTVNEDICITGGFCENLGNGLNSSIIYGNKEYKKGKLTTSDAFNCDVNGDGVYDSKNERFYYVTSLESNKDYAVLISSKNYNNSIVVYDKKDLSTNGPVNILNYLPTSQKWKNISLYSPKRNIISEETKIINENFEYEGVVARLLSIQEINKACGEDNGLPLVKNCEFLLENTGYASAKNSGYWLENKETTTTEGHSAFYISGVVGYANVKTTSYGIRPVIEILKEEISY